jgi:hypothetical protein
MTVSQGLVFVLWCGSNTCFAHQDLVSWGLSTQFIRFKPKIMEPVSLVWDQRTIRAGQAELGWLLIQLYIHRSMPIYIMYVYKNTDVCTHGEVYTPIHCKLPWPPADHPFACSPVGFRSGPGRSGNIRRTGELDRGAGWRFCYPVSNRIAAFCGGRGQPGSLGLLRPYFNWKRDYWLSFRTNSLSSLLLLAFDAV